MRNDGLPGGFSADDLRPAAGQNITVMLPATRLTPPANRGPIRLWCYITTQRSGHPRWIFWPYDVLVSLSDQNDFASERMRDASFIEDVRIATCAIAGFS